MQGSGMHWYTWALVAWALVSGVPALAVLCFLLPRVVAARFSELVTSRGTASPLRPSTLIEQGEQDAA
jgi:hypothetical protein